MSGLAVYNRMRFSVIKFIWTYSEVSCVLVSWYLFFDFFYFVKKSSFFNFGGLYFTGKHSNCAVNWRFSSKTVAFGFFMLPKMRSVETFFFISASCFNELILTATVLGVSCKKVGKFIQEKGRERERLFL